MGSADTRCIPKPRGRKEEDMAMIALVILVIGLVVTNIRVVP